MEKVEIPIDFEYRYEQVAEQVLEMEERNVSVAVIEHTLGISSQQRIDASRFARTGERPARKKAKPQRHNLENAGKGRTNWSREHAAQVAQMRDVDGLKFIEIARRLGKPDGMIYKAYDFAHPELVNEAAEKGHAIRRDPKKARLRPNEIARMDGLLLANSPTGIVAKVIGCSVQTVVRRKDRLAKLDIEVYRRQVNESLATDQEFSDLLAKASEMQAAANQPGLKSRRLSPDEVAIAKDSILQGDPVKVTAQLVGCSTRKISELRTQMKSDRAA